MTYVNLLLNPERYTGYKGESARRIWRSIYAENCFKDGENDTCTEKRIFYRLISGLHTSINTHICANYLIDEQKNKWGQNLEMFRERVAKFPDRLQNLYFTFLFILRAVTKAGDYLTHVSYSTGNPPQDDKTLSLLQHVARSDRLAGACHIPFQEGGLWRGEGGIELRRELKDHFRNISAMMDCVGCEKCRLWGKLQVLGLATAFKILFEDDINQLELQRNEVVALINFLARLSESIRVASEFLVKLEKGEEGEVVSSIEKSKIPYRGLFPT